MFGPMARGAASSVLRVAAALMDNMPPRDSHQAGPGQWTVTALLVHIHLEHRYCL